MTAVRYSANNWIMNGRVVNNTKLVRILLLALLSSALLWGCSSAPTTPTVKDESGPMYTVPRYWQIVDEKESGSLYQANLTNNAGAGRMLLGRLKMRDDVGEVDAYLYKLHKDLVEKVRGETNFVPFSEERVVWDNGTVGYRTRMRGELGREVVIIEGITLSDKTNAYFNYGLFPEENYDQDRLAYAEVLRSLTPIRGATRLRNIGMDIQADSPESDVGTDGAASPADYQSPATHLGVAAWGSARTDIESAAGPPPRRGQVAIGYNCQFLATEDCVVIYMFEYGQLTHGGFLFEEKYDNPQQHVARYLRMTKDLSDRFGRPLQSAAIWGNPALKNEGKRWGEALANGDVLFGTVWQIGPSKVVHSLRKSDSGEIEHRLLASNDELRSQLQSAKK